MYKILQFCVYIYVVMNRHANRIFLRHITNVNCFGGLEVACWPLVPKFAGSNPAEAVGFNKKKSTTRLPSEGK
jgi:hypothetical protein